MATADDTRTAPAQPSIGGRAELLSELGITPLVQRRLDRIADKLAKVRQELEAAREACGPGTDTDARCEQALELLDETLYHIQWRAPDVDGECPS